MFKHWKSLEEAKWLLFIWNSALLLGPKKSDKRLQKYCCENKYFFLFLNSMEKQKQVPYIVVAFPSHLKKLRCKPRFWLKKLNCGFFHSFHLWKNNFSHHFSVENNYFKIRVYRPLEYLGRWSSILFCKLIFFKQEKFIFCLFPQSESIKWNKTEINFSSLFLQINKKNHKKSQVFLVLFCPLQYAVFHNLWVWAVWRFYIGIISYIGSNIRWKMAK